MTKNGNKGNYKDGKSNQPTTSLILKIKLVYPSKLKVQVTFKDKEGEMIKEKVHMYRDGEHKATVDAGETTHPDGGRYSLFKEVR